MWVLFRISFIILGATDSHVFFLVQKLPVLASALTGITFGGRHSCWLTLVKSADCSRHSNLRRNLCIRNDPSQQLWIHKAEAARKMHKALPLDPHDILTNVKAESSSKGKIHHIHRLDLLRWFSLHQISWNLHRGRWDVPSRVENHFYPPKLSTSRVERIWPTIYISYLPLGALGPQCLIRLSWFNCLWKQGPEWKTRNYLWNALLRNKDKTQR